MASALQCQQPIEHLPRAVCPHACPNENKKTGKRVSSRIATASLGVVNPGNLSANASSIAADDGPQQPTNAGGSVVQGYADTVDRSDFASTRTGSAFAPDQNTVVEVKSRGSATRYDVTQGLGEGSATVSWGMGEEEEGEEGVGEGRLHGSCEWWAMLRDFSSRCPAMGRNSCRRMGPTLRKRA